MDTPSTPFKPAHGALLTGTDLLSFYDALIAAGQTDLAAKLAKKCNGFADEATRKRLAAYIENVDADNDGDVECDGPNGSSVSLGSDPGAYVLVWRWVSDEGAGLAKENEEDES